MEVKFPASMIITGKTKSGKTYFTKSLIDKAHSQFDYIFIYSSTADISGDFDEFEKKHRKKTMIITDENEFLELLNDENFNEQILNDKNLSKLIIIDDFIGFIDLHANKKFDSLASRGRHLNISVMYLTQHIFAMTPCIRLNCDYIFLTKTSDNNIKQLYDLSCGFANKDDLKRKMQEYRIIEITTPYLIK